MSVRLRDVLMEQLGAAAPRTDRQADPRRRSAARPSSTRTRALLVWEPKRIVPTYAVPARATSPAQLVAAPAPTGGATARVCRRWACRTSVTAGVRPERSRSRRTPPTARSLLVRVAGADRRRRRVPSPPTPTSRATCSSTSTAFDAWYEEDDLNVAHPRDPFHRVDIVHSSRPRAGVELEGTGAGGEHVAVPAVRAAVAGRATTSRPTTCAPTVLAAERSTSRTAPTRA